MLQRANKLLRRRAGGRGVGGCVGVSGALSCENDRRREAERCVGVMEGAVMGGGSGGGGGGGVVSSVSQQQPASK